ncbi:MAG: putative ABC transporter permease [Oscillospiraceae bacterium]|nr:putative ABC transporter permease [Oscillospiraceae bacterium]
MNLGLSLAYLFFLGSLLGWGLELVFRKFFSSANPEHKWINPGFCMGPYVPLYGVGLCLLYLISSGAESLGVHENAWGRVGLFVCMMLVLTAIEYIAGLFCLRVMKVRLWDYSKQPGNFQGLICPFFSLVWGAAGSLYFYVIHPYTLNALGWLQTHLAFSFAVGYFFGVFSIDVVYSMQLVARIKQYAEENEVVVRYEALKAHIQSFVNRNAQENHIRSPRLRFFFPFRSPRSLNEHLREAIETLEERRRKHMK